MKRILSVTGLVMTFAVAYGLQRLVAYMTAEMGVTCSAALFKGTVWVQSIAPVILATILLTLAWYVVFRTNRDVWVGVVFLAAGLFGTIVFAIEMLLEKTSLSDRLWNLVLPETYGHCVAAFVLVIGLACLVGRKRQKIA